MKTKKIYSTPLSTIVEVGIEQNILLDLSSGTTKGGGAALGNMNQGKWGDLWEEQPARVD
jgi:hypothetical protein